MTTIVAVKRGDTACIAADTLTKYGDALESADYVVNADKLVRVGKAWLGPTGPASAQLVLASYFGRPEVEADLEDVEGIFETLLELQVKLKDEYFLNPKEDERDPFDSTQMEILIVSPGGIFGAYPLRSVMEYTRFYAFGSGAEYALGAMQVLYEQGASAEEVAAGAIEAAARFDDSTGLPYTLEKVRLT